jgi:hypothetical protein
MKNDGESLTVKNVPQSHLPAWFWDRQAVEAKFSIETKVDVQQSAA